MSNNHIPILSPLNHHIPIPVGATDNWLVIVSSGILPFFIPLLMFDTPHYISIKTAYTEYFWRIIKLEHPPFDDTIPNHLCFSHFWKIVFPIPTFSTHHGDATFPWWSSGIHPFFSIFLQFSKSQLLQRSGRPTRPRSARTTSAPHPAGDASKKKGSIKQALMMVIRWLYDVDTISDVYMMF